MSPSHDEEYDEATALPIAFRPALERLIQDLLKADDIRFHSVTCRVKAKDSVARKLESGGGVRSLESLTDILGIRIITYFRDEVDAVARLIEREFSIDEENSVDKRDILDPDRFGYLSVHYIATLNASRGCLAEYRKYCDVKFEIQVRSILQHAWAEIEHDLGYKSEAAIPRSIRRRFSRLAGLLEIADDEFVGIRQELTAHQEHTAAVILKKVSNLEIDQDSLYSYSQASERVRDIDQFIADILNGRLGDATDPRSYMGNQAERLVRFGFISIEDLDRGLSEESDLLKEFVLKWIGNRILPRIKRRVPHGITFYYLGLLKQAQRCLVNPEEEEVYENVTNKSLEKALQQAVGILSNGKETPSLGLGRRIRHQSPEIWPLSQKCNVVSAADIRHVDV